MSQKTRYLIYLALMIPIWFFACVGFVKAWNYFGIGEPSLPSHLSVTGRLKVSLSSGLPEDKYKNMTNTCTLIEGGRLSTDNFNNVFVNFDRSQPIFVSYIQSPSHSPEECPSDFTFMIGRAQLKNLAKAEAASTDEKIARGVAVGIMMALPVH